ncbi:MAG: xanthine dehydrogenase family protein subunit M [Pseudomonadota bacterium]
MTQTEFHDTKTTDGALTSADRYIDEGTRLRHFNTRTIDEAVSLLVRTGEGAMIIAGGVDVVGLMRNRLVSPKTLINIKTIPDLAYIKEDAEGLKIGALTTIKEIAKSPLIRSKYSILFEAASSVAAPQIRNMGTISGNLCQDVRCWYYRRPPVTGRVFFCRKKGGRFCYAVGGQNQYHAIIGGKECYAVCPSDMAPALTALGAKVKVVGERGERVIPLDEFYKVFGNVLRPDEIITEAQVPIPGGDTIQRYLKFRYRKTIDFAISSVAAVITVEDTIVKDARIVLGGVAPTPYRAIEAEEVLKGKKITMELAEKSAKAALQEAKPLSMNGFKIPITEALVRRAIVG